MTNLDKAKGLALAVPAALLAGAYVSQYWGGLFPCHMCWWQRYAHFAALPCLPCASTRPERMCCRYSAGVAHLGASVQVRPMSMPAWSSEPPTPVPPCVSM